MSVIEPLPVHSLNELGQPLDAPVPDWQAPPRPPRTAMEGRTCSIVPLEPGAHTVDLHAANMIDASGANWTYPPYGPFESLEDYRAWMDRDCMAEDPMFHAIINKGTGKAVGVASYLRIDPQAGSIEVGHINFSPLLQRTPAATEAMYLMMKRAFELGYRRYEWKCNELNEPSRRAAMRLGLSYEGVFRQMLVTKGRNRNTAWYASIDAEWPALERAFTTWLAPENFDADGRQSTSLSTLTHPILVREG